MTQYRPSAAPSRRATRHVNLNKAEPSLVIPDPISQAMARAQSHEDAAELQQAEDIYRHLLAAHPRFHPALQAWGLLAFRTGNLAFAAELFGSAIGIDGSVGLYYRNYGEISRRLGRFGEAVAAGQHACARMPADVDAHFNLALALSDAGDRVNAAAAYRKVLELQESAIAQGRADANLWNQRGVAWHRLQQFDDARLAYECALELDPNHVVALNSLGSLTRETGQIGEAAGTFARALEIAPDYAEARLNLGMAQLQLGHWEHGWENYEARWSGSAESNIGTFLRPACPLPQWDGGDESAGQAILVYAEQGNGDTLQFARFLDVLCTRFARVALVCPLPQLQLLMEWTLGERVLLLKEMPRDFSAWDWHCPMMSLPRAFRVTPDTLPAATPYLRVSPLAWAYWQARLERTAPARLKVGLAWQGRRAHKSDWRRSIAFARLAPLFAVPGIAWVSLQKLEAGEAKPMPAEPVSWFDWSEELHDFADSAALAVNLDLVISIDSAVAHLAGALNRPVWMLNRHESEWRWLEGREDSPWYPGMRIFRQPGIDDWDSVLQTVRAALSQLLEARA